MIMIIGILTAEVRLSCVPYSSCSLPISHERTAEKKRRRTIQRAWDILLDRAAGRPAGRLDPRVSGSTRLNGANIRSLPLQTRFSPVRFVHSHALRVVLSVGSANTNSFNTRMCLPGHRCQQRFHSASRLMSARRLRLQSSESGTLPGLPGLTEV